MRFRRVLLGAGCDPLQTFYTLHCPLGRPCAGTRTNGGPQTGIFSCKPAKTNRTPPSNRQGVIRCYSFRPRTPGANVRTPWGRGLSPLHSLPHVTFLLEMCMIFLTYLSAAADCTSDSLRHLSPRLCRNRLCPTTAILVERSATYVLAGCWPSCLHAPEGKRRQGCVDRETLRVLGHIQHRRARHGRRPSHARMCAHVCRRRPRCRPNGSPHSWKRPKPKPDGVSRASWGASPKAPPPSALSTCSNPCSKVLGHSRPPACSAPPCFDVAPGGCACCPSPCCSCRSRPCLHLCPCP